MSGDGTARLPGLVVGARWLAGHLDGRGPVVLDATVVLEAARRDGDYVARSGLERFEEAHVPGARHADLLGSLADHEAPYHFARPAPEELLVALAALGVGGRRPVVCYDSTGGLFAARLWWMLRWVGLESAVLDGGLEAWRGLGLPLESGPAPAVEAVAPAPPRRRAVPDETMWIDRRGVEDVLAGRRRASLVCALGADQFAGTAPSRYARRGHIPTSASLPARELFDEHGAYLSRPALAARVVSALGPPGDPLVLYCGGAISVGPLALALTVLGYRDVAVYDGSLEEWAADPSLPLELGAPS